MWSSEEALSGPLDKAEAVYRANLEMRCFRQEVVRVVLLDVQNCWITSVDICKGTLEESLAHPRDIFRPVIVHVNCHIKCDWQWFWPNYVRLSLPQYLRLGEKIQETGLLVSLTGWL